MTRVMRTWLILGLIVGACGWDVARGDDGLQVAATEDAVVMENAFLRVRIAALGGKITSLYAKQSQVEYAGVPEAEPEVWRGLGKDRLWGNAGFMGLMEGRYALSVVRDTTSQAVVEAVFQGGSGPIRGMTYTKRYVLERETSAVRVDYRIHSDQPAGVHAPWIHNLVQMPRETAVLYCQMNEGLYRKPVKEIHEPANLFVDYQEPWIGLVDPERAVGLVQLTDRKQTRQMMCWVGKDPRQPVTLEAVYQPVEFEEDGTFTTSMHVLPTFGLRALHLASEDYVGGFERDGSQAVFLLMPTRALPSAEISVYDKEDGHKRIGRIAGSFKPGEIVRCPVEMGEGGHSVLVSIKTGNHIRQHNIRASLTPMPSEVDSIHSIAEAESTHRGGDPVEVLTVKDRTYVSSDIPTILHFNLQHRLKDPTFPAELVIELPKGIRLVGPGSMTAEPCQVDGEDYGRYVIQKEARIQRGWQKVFLASDWPAGQSGHLYYYVKWADGAQSRQRLNVESVSIEPAPLPQRLITTLGWQHLGLAHEWPNFYRNMRYLGMNTVTSLHGDLYLDHRNPGSLAQAVQDAKSHGLWFAANYSPFTRSHFLRQVIEENAQAVDINGVPSPEGYVDPSYRGKAFQDEVDRIVHAARSGISMIWYDAETWNGRQYGFSENNLQQFESYLKSEDPSIEYVSPKIFEQEPGRYPRLHEAWLDFRVRLGQRMFDRIRRELDEVWRDSPPESGPFHIVGSYNLTPGKVYHQFQRFDEFYASGAVNVCMPSLYVGADAAKVAQSVKHLRTQLGRGRIIPWLTAGYGTIGSEYESVAVKYIVLENFINGAMGFTFFHWYGFDGLDFKYLTEAMRMVVPVEDIIVDGDVVESVRSSHPRVKVCGLQQGDHMVVLVSDYWSTMPVETRLGIPVTSERVVVDMQTRQVIATVGPDQSEFDVRLVRNDQDRARLMYVGPREDAVALGILLK